MGWSRRLTSSCLVTIGTLGRTNETGSCRWMRPPGGRGWECYKFMLQKGGWKNDIRNVQSVKCEFENIKLRTTSGCGPLCDDFIWNVHNTCPAYLFKVPCLAHNYGDSLTFLQGLSNSCHLPGLFLLFPRDSSGQKWNATDRGTCVFFQPRNPEQSPLVYCFPPTGSSVLGLIISTQAHYSPVIWVAINLDVRVFQWQH